MCECVCVSACGCGCTFICCVFACVCRRDVATASSLEEELKSFVESVMKVHESTCA